MNIAMLVRSYIPSPRPKDMIYAPIDLAVAIGEGLAKRGHKVDYYGPIGTSIKGAKVRTCDLRPLVNNQEEFKTLLADKDKLSHNQPGLWDSYMVNEMFKRASAGLYDILHFHHPESAMPIAKMFPAVPAVYTLHDPVHCWNRELFELYATSNQRFISISNNQRRDAPDLPYVSTVYDGVGVEEYPFSSTADDYLLFAGRIIPDKGVKEAIQVARQTKRRLLIIGPVYPDSQGYFDQYIKPQLDDQILYLGFVEKEQMWRYYQKAYALLTPVQWEEPFGLTTIEAMACGTPVISLKRGAAQEIIENGENGYLVESIKEMIKAVKKVGGIDRAHCRDYVKEKFSIDKMLDGYEQVFAQVLRERSKLSSHYLRTSLRKLPRPFSANRLKTAKTKATRVSSKKLTSNNDNSFVRTQF